MQNSEVGADLRWIMGFLGFAHYLSRVVARKTRLVVELFTGDQSPNTPWPRRTILMKFVKIQKIRKSVQNSEVGADLRWISGDHRISRICSLSQPGGGPKNMIGG